ncbi:MAG: tRNA (adenosine(37)-N6)-threonylcarbamoyltransferase complex dimerization subunit type 1 TsaB [Lachnospiraceae bacterium]|nr:tRNA (adenosine(37)-N6)-threonylcarbamoyltransferase complex dimerization subunit type 1 TsaB [Lachnospiraceae bacterium]
MKILAVDSSGLTAGVAIVEDFTMTAEYTVNYKKTHSQTLLPMLDEICRMTELDLSGIDAIAVTKGPGSFTGLRIGSATVKGLGLALQKPIIPVPTVDCLAMNAWGYHGLVCPMMDARRSQVYTGLYRFDRVGAYEPTVLLSQRPMAVGEMIDRLNEAYPEETVLFLGDGVPVYEELLRDGMKGRYELAPAHMARQRAGALGVLAAVYRQKGIYESAGEHKPEYLRLSQAERERQQANEKSGDADIMIRPMTETDADQVAAIEETTFSMPWRKQDFLDMIARDHMNYLVAEKNGRIIGGAGIREIVGDIEITNVVIAEEYRGQGYGRRLMEAVLSEGRRLGGTQFTLEVRRSNTAAVRLYEGAGFQTEGVRKDFYEKPREDALIMWKRD